MNFLSDYVRMTHLCLTTMTFNVLLLETRSVSGGGYTQLKMQLHELLHVTQSEIERVQNGFYQEIEDLSDQFSTGIIGVASKIKEGIKAVPEGVDSDRLSQFAYKLSTTGLEAINESEAAKVALIQKLLNPLQEQVQALIKRIEAL